MKIMIEGVKEKQIQIPNALLWNRLSMRMGYHYLRKKTNKVDKQVWKILSRCMCKTFFHYQNITVVEIIDHDGTKIRVIL